MPVLVRRSGAFVPGQSFYVKIAGSWRSAKKVYTKQAGVWKEGWPRAPNPPTNVKLTQTFDSGSDDIEMTVTWAAPAAGAEPVSKYQVRLVFTNKTTGAVAATAWVDKTTAQFSHLFDNSGSGWQHRSATNTVYAQVASFSGTTVPATVWGTHFSAVAATAAQTVIDLPIPGGVTNFDVNIDNCVLTQTWSHVGGNSLNGFQIETWVGTSPHAIYNLPATARSWNQYPWNAATVGRQSVYTRIRALGDGGYTAWVTVSGVMPGPVTYRNFRFRNGRLEAEVLGNYDGMAVYTHEYGGSPVFVVNAGPTANAGSTPYVLVDAASTGYARDNSSRYGFGVRPRNAANGWTGRYQGSGWAIKIPNPVAFTANSNTWWSSPIPGKWRDNPQAENWMYQGKSISGNSVGTLFYGTAIAPYFSTSRLGYDPAVSKLEVYVKRAVTGGLVAGVPISVWTHNEVDDSNDAFPGLVEGPYVGASYVRGQGAWQAIPASWFHKMQAGTARGLCFYVDFNHPENQLRSEIGNVSNMYMIIDKPHYGAPLNGYPPGTLRVYHDG